MISKRLIIGIVSGILLLIVIIWGMNYFSSHVGWYGYNKSNHRVATTSIRESKARGVFVNELHFKIDSSYEGLFSFEVYLEKGFRYGYDSDQKTRILTGTQYPYQLSFTSRPSNAMTISIREDQLKKFDSSAAVWGYLRQPKLTDTVILIIGGGHIEPGEIKVWQGT